LFRLGGFGGWTGQGGGQGGVTVWGSRLSLFGTAVIWIWVVGVASWVIVDLPNFSAVGVGWFGWAKSSRGGGRQELMWSSWHMMRFIPSMSASNISNRWRMDLDCWVCSTRMLVDCSKILLVVSVHRCQYHL